MKFLQAMHHVRSLKGSCNPHMILCDDGNLYIAKLKRTEVPRNLVSEMLGMRLAEGIGLPVPKGCLIEIPHSLMQFTPALSAGISNRSSLSTAGPHFGSAVGADNACDVYDVLPETEMRKISNFECFAGMLAFDILCGNKGSRKAVFKKSPVTRTYQAQFINFDECFGGDEWVCRNDRGWSLYSSRCVYSTISSWNDFEPYLSRLITMSPHSIREVIATVPLDWYDVKRGELEGLVEAVLKQRLRLHGLIVNTINSAPNRFPCWKPRTSFFVTVAAHSLSLLQVPKNL